MMRIENEKRKEETKLSLRVYKPADCKALTELFYETVHSVNTKDYTKEQVEVEAELKKHPIKTPTPTQPKPINATESKPSHPRPQNNAGRGRNAGKQQRHRK